MNNINYSRITLRPNDKELRKTFNEFRKTDVEQMFPYWCGFLTALGVTFALVLINDNSTATHTQFVFGLASAALHWLVWFIGRRFTGKLIPAMLVIYLAEMILIQIEAHILASEMDTNAFVQILLYRITGFYQLNMLLLSP